MSAGEGLTPRERSEMRDLVLAGTQRIHPSDGRRTQFIAAGVALVLVGAVAGGVLTAALGQSERPAPFASGEGRPAGAVPTAGTAPEVVPTDVDPQVWIDSLPDGEPPLTPYAHDGVLHVSGTEIVPSFEVGAIEVAGSTVIVGGGARDGVPASWWLVDGDALVPFPATQEYYPSLSADGSIIFWQEKRSADTTTFVMWDVATNQELATHTVDGDFDTSNRLHIIGVDADGIAYWVNESSDPPVWRWDVRNGVVEPTDLPFESRKAFSEQADPIPEVWRGFEDNYVSPDGTREIFTDTQLRVRPLGSSAADEITTLQLPEGVPGEPLWRAYTDRGATAWWETNETILLIAQVDEHATLVRCWATGGACERVFDLGAHAAGYTDPPEWQQDWVLGMVPVRG
ncbi:hypothetical protein [Microbacterium sp. 2FI]|uniref:hypothetical protein n=1 Tax=Microbacterium sp. 2FI TaxID=2502193 RepID=UPI0010F908C9|nr:hypothetical protein [Microbacterium sp. 2FI]